MLMASTGILIELQTFVRLIAKTSLIFLLFLLWSSLPARADWIATKSGQTYKGKLIGKNENSYIFRVDSTGETVEIAATNLYMGDFDPDPKASLKHYLTRESFAQEGEEGNRPPPPPKIVNSEPAPSTSDSSGQSMNLLKKYGNVLKNAEDTVKLSNQRTEEVQKKLEELKNIADNANK